MPKFREFEINDFRGIASSNRNPRKNEAQICKNFDLREITGDLTSRLGYRRRFAANNIPDVTTSPIHSTDYNISNATWLRATSFIVEIGGTEQEVTLQIGKGTLRDLASVGDINIGLFFIRPYWDALLTGGTVSSATNTTVTSTTTTTSNQYVGSYLKCGSETRKIISHTTGTNTVFTTEWFNTVPSGSFEIWDWTDNWLWLNECYLTDIDNLSNNTFRINGTFPNTADYFKDWIAYNVTEDCYHQIYDSAYVDATETTVSLVAATGSVTHDFANTDRVLVMRNFIPYADLQEYYNATKKEICFHNVISDLRIGFGGFANRLALMVGYRNKSFQVENDAGGLLGSSAIQQVSDIDKIILAPYNALTENTKAATLPAWGDQNAFHIMRMQASATNELPDGRWFMKLTALIDGYEEFVLPAVLKQDLTGANIDTVGSTVSYFDTSSQKMFLQFRIFWALFNKRFTKLRLYVSYDSTTSADEPTAPYYLLKEWDLIGAAAATGYDFNNYGYLYDNTGGTAYSFSFGNTQWTNLQKAGTTELEAKLNYPLPDDPATDYVRGYDHAAVVEGKAFVTNPYIGGERLENYLFFSPFSGAGASQYDALQGGNYISVDSHDGNNLKGLGIFSNANLAAFKTNTLTKIRPGTAQVADLAFGYGLDTFRSIVNHGDRLTWCSQEDILSTNGVVVRNLSENTIRSLFRAISDKTNIIATNEERENAYRFYDGVSTQYVLTERGWVSIDPYLDPDDFFASKDGNLVFMKSGGCYNLSTYYNDIDASGNLQAVSYQWKSIPFDIALLGEGLIQSHRFWIDGIFCKYSTPADLTLKIYLDGSGTAFDTITLSSSSTYYDTAIKYGAIGHKVEIEITGSINSNTVPVIISSIGLRWRTMEVGNRV